MSTDSKNFSHLTPESLRYYSKSNCRRCFGKGQEVYYNPTTKQRTTVVCSCVLRRFKQGK
jgi:hypothetical protein